MPGIRRRGRCLSPLAAPALRDSAVITFSGVIAFGGSHSGGGETPIERFTFYETFLQSLKV